MSRYLVATGDSAVMESSPETFSIRKLLWNEDLNSARPGNRGNSRFEAGDKDGTAADCRQAAKLNPSLRQATEMLPQVETRL